MGRRVRKLRVRRGMVIDAVLITFIGGVGTVHGPILGAALFVFLREYLALRWVDLHLLIFGALFNRDRAAPARRARRGGGASPRPRRGRPAPSRRDIRVPA